MKDLTSILINAINEAFRINKDTKISKYPSNDFAKAAIKCLQYKSDIKYTNSEIKKFGIEKYINDFFSPDEKTHIHLYEFDIVIDNDSEIPDDSEEFAKQLRDETEYGNITVIDDADSFSKVSVKAGFNAGYPSKAKYGISKFKSTPFSVYSSNKALSVWVGCRGILIVSDEYVKENIEDISEVFRIDKNTKLRRNTTFDLAKDIKYCATGYDQRKESDNNSYGNQLLSMIEDFLSQDKFTNNKNLLGFGVYINVDELTKRRNSTVKNNIKKRILNNKKLIGHFCDTSSFGALWKMFITQGKYKEIENYFGGFHVYYNEQYMYICHKDMWGVIITPNVEL